MNTVKKILLLLTVVLSIQSLSAQNIYPLTHTPKNKPEYSYFKDLDNVLPFFAGTWKATAPDREYTLYITNAIKKYFEKTQYKYYRDVLEVRYVVKDGSGTVLQDTRNAASGSNKIENNGYLPNYGSKGDAVTFGYSGTNCYYGSGTILFHKRNSTQFEWVYWPDGDLFLDDCMKNSDIKIYLPKNVVFTKTNTLSNTERL